MGRKSGSLAGKASKLGLGVSLVAQDTEFLGTADEADVTRNSRWLVLSTRDSIKFPRVPKDFHHIAIHSSQRFECVHLALVPMR